MRIRVIDRYKLNLYCTCLGCEQFQPSKKERLPHSCNAYPKQNGIPPKVWNGEYEKCEHSESFKGIILTKNQEKCIMYVGQKNKQF